MQIGFLCFGHSSINGHQSGMAGAFCVERGVFMYPMELQVRERKKFFSCLTVYRTEKPLFKRRVIMPLSNTLNGHAIIPSLTVISVC